MENNKSKTNSRKTKQQTVIKKKEKQLKKVRENKKNKKKNVVPKGQKAQGRNVKNYQVKGDPKLTLGQGVRSNIMEVVPMDPDACSSFYLPIISNAITMGAPNTQTAPIFWAFLAAITDFINILTSEVAFVSNRLFYFNQILAAYVPKTLPFKTGTISYAWSGVTTTTVASTYTLRSFKYSMFYDNGLTAGVWSVFSAPPVPSSPIDALPVYSSVMAQIANNQQPHLRLVEDAELNGPWTTDSSPYSQCSVYYGAGNTNGADGPAYSAELEIPKKSTILTGMTSFSASNGRVARVFSLSSGGAACASGIAFLPKWDMSLYNTCYPVQYCFLDLDEVVLWLEQWYIQLVLKSINIDNPTFNAGLIPFTYTAQQMRLAVRQTVIGFFPNAQNMAQFMTYTTNNNGFEPFRCGTNCAALNRQTMLMPELLVENLRMLLPTYIDVPTKFHNDKNQLIYVPVWGIEKSVINDPINLTGNFWNEESQTYETTQMFAPPNPDDPNPIDGYNSSGAPCNLNGTIITNFITEWNSRIEDLKTASLPTTYLTGSSGATLLTYTRYCRYIEGEQDLSTITPYMRHNIPKQFLKTKEVETRDKIGTRTPSKEGQIIKKKLKQVYVPPLASLYEQQSVSYSSLGLITQEAIQLMNYFIFPTIVIESTQPPSQKQVRSATTQSYIYDLDVEGETALLSTRAFKLVELGKMCAPGVAAQGSDELQNVIKAFAEQGKGGFVGDMLGYLTRLIPI